jgi:hypothetical protein
MTPTAAGLVDAERKYPCWTVPDVDEDPDDDVGLWFNE